MIKNRNFSGQTTPSIISERYESCNFSQPAPDEVGGLKVGVRLFPGDDTPRRFEECNLVNALPPPGSILVGCNTTIRESAVIVSSDTVTIDGQSLTVNNYADKIYGRTNPTTLEVDYKPSPTIIPVEVEE